MLESALDPDEISRLEFERGGTAGLHRLEAAARRESNGRPELLGIASVGILLQPDRLIIVTPDDTPLVDDGDRAESLRRLLLRIMASTVNEFLVELKRVKRTSRDIQAKLTKSLENRELLRMFSLSEGLVYHINAIEANGRVLRRLRHLAQRLGFDEEELEFLDDIVIDNDQCSRQGQIFSTVLAGHARRARQPHQQQHERPAQEPDDHQRRVPAAHPDRVDRRDVGVLDDADSTTSIDWRVGYVGFSVAMVVLGLAFWFIVLRFINRTGNH